MAATLSGEREVLFRGERRPAAPTYTTNWAGAAGIAAQRKPCVKARWCWTANTLILDEADRMLDMGYDAIEDIISKTPPRRQTLLFSATYPVSIKQLASKFMRAPQQVKAEAFHSDDQIEQRFYEISPEERMDAVTKVLAHFRPASCVAFCFTKQQVQETVDHLTAKGISAVGLHGDLEQRDRDQVLAMFANRSTSVLVATDVAARGLDIDALDMVINVELARDSEIHIHRVGRTGRAGETGIAISLVAPSEAHRAQAIEQLQKSPLNWDQLDNLKPQSGGPLLPQMSTLCIAAGRKDKVRPGDILGALTGEAGIPGAQVGKIAIFDFQAFVAVERGIAKQALQRLNDGKIRAVRCACVFCKDLSMGEIIVGLARECGVSVDMFVTEPPHSRASPLPHLTVFQFRIL